MIDTFLSLLQYALTGAGYGAAFGVSLWAITSSTSTTRGAIPLITIFGYVPVGVIIAVIMFILGI